MWKKLFRGLSEPPELLVIGCIRSRPEALFRREHSRRVRWWHWWTAGSKTWLVKNCMYTFRVRASTKQSAIRKTVQLFHDVHVPLREDLARCRLSADLWKPEKPTVWHARLGQHSTLVSAKRYEEALEKAESFFMDMDSDPTLGATVEVWRFELRDTIETTWSFCLRSQRQDS